MTVRLSSEQQEIFSQVRNTLTELLASVSRTNLQQAETETLRDTLKTLEDRFLIVIVGEFNSGKSTFINALLNTDLLQTGVTPTTALIHLIRHGETQTITSVEDWGLLVTLPSPLLESVSLVDTPGTNSVFADHAILTNWFFPRADLVIFVTSADRPYSESESHFLQEIRQWGKKLIIILNKTDQVEGKKELEDIVRFIQENAQRELKTDIPVLAVSSRTADTARKNQAPELWEESGFRRLEQFLQDRLNESSRFKIKMESALGVAEKLAAETESLLVEEQAFYQEDLELTELIQNQAVSYQTELDKEINRSIREIRSIFAEIKKRGNDYFEELFRVKNIPNILKKEKNQLDFQDKVLKTLPTEIERKTNEMVESIYFQQQQMTQFATLQIEKRKTHFPGSGISASEQTQRKELLQKMQRSIDDILDKLKHEMAEEIGQKHVRSAVATGLAIEVSAIGIGAALTIIATTVATDILGIVAAFWIGIAGFLVMPYYRKKSQKEFETQISSVEEKLVHALEKELRSEVSNQARQFEQAVAPFRQYVQNALQKIAGVHNDLEKIQEEILQIRQQL